MRVSVLLYDEYNIVTLSFVLFNDNLLIFSHSLILDSSFSDVMFLLLSSLNESIVLERVVSSAYIMK